ncbi:MAG: hypothetical protein ACLPVF_01595 [Acidimicrobiales bacterium]
MEGVLGWEQAEGGNWENTARFNPLDTTQPFDGSWNYDLGVVPGVTAQTPGVQAYNNWADGVTATVITLKNGYYPYILAAMSQGDFAAQVAAYSPSVTGDLDTWGTGNFADVLPPNYSPPAPSWETPCTAVDTSGEAWVPVTTNGTSDYCRPVGAGPDWVASYLACTSFNGTSFGPTVVSGLTDWGYDSARAWVSVGGGADYCRLVGAGPPGGSFLACTPFNGTSFGSTVDSGVVDWGQSANASWVLVGSDVDYCTLGGAGPDWVASYLECTPFNGTSFGSTVTSGITDWGWSTGASWVPVTGGADFCRRVGGGPDWVASYLACNTFNGSSFGPTQISGLTDWGYDTAAMWVPVGSDVDYCRQVGGGPDLVASYLECTSFDGSVFGSSVLSGLVDWGYDVAATWVPVTGGADYCRRVGAGPPNDSDLECSTFNGTSFGTTGLSGPVDWGYDPGATWVAAGVDARYCSWTGATQLTCTAFNGSSFGPSINSGVVTWGYDT